MEDRYLYRAKRRDNGEWVHGCLIQSVTGSYYIVKEFDHIFGLLDRYEVDPSTICRCTGLKDENGNLIWDKDILSDAGYTHTFEKYYRKPKTERVHDENHYDKDAQWLEELKQYRSIGTVDECRAAVKIHKELNKRSLTLENIEEYMKFEDECVKKGFTFKSLLEAREKQAAKRPDYEGDGYSDGHLVYDTWICPCCGKRYEVDYDNYDYCPNCGQKLDWNTDTVTEQEDTEARR